MIDYNTRIVKKSRGTTPLVNIVFGENAPGRAVTSREHAESERTVAGILVDDVIIEVTSQCRTFAGREGLVWWLYPIHCRWPGSVNPIFGSLNQRCWQCRAIYLEKSALGLEMVIIFERFGSICPKKALHLAIGREHTWNLTRTVEYDSVWSLDTF